MGPFTPTHSSQSATFRAPTTSTTTPLRSLADQGGVFDAPWQKCPPDRGGSSDCVTDSPAPLFATQAILAASPFHRSHSPTPSALSYYPSTPPDRYASDIVYPPTPPPEHGHPGSPPSENGPFAGGPGFGLSNVPPILVPKPRLAQENVLATPPHTPEDHHLIGGGGGGSSRADGNRAALDFISKLFPRHGPSVLPYARSVSIAAPNGGAFRFEGVVLSLPGEPRTFYVDGKKAESVNLRESIVALLDLADEQLNCSAVVIALDRSSSALAELIHALMYVGGAVVTKRTFPVDPGYVLVGMEL